MFTVASDLTGRYATFDAKLIAAPLFSHGRIRDCARYVLHHWDPPLKHLAQEVLTSVLRIVTGYNDAVESTWAIEP